jgi:hypothetical protein
MIIEKLGTWKFKLDIYCVPSWLRTFRPLRITISRPIGLILPSPGLKIVYIYIYPLWQVSFETTNHLGVSENQWKNIANWPFNQKIVTNPRILGLN